jgi:2-dehydropantoate 2-reductase
MAGKRIAVVGAGAIGGYVGGYLARAGYDVTLIDPWPEHVEAIRRDGLEITGTTEAETFFVQAPTLHVTELQSLAKQKPIDIAFVSVKSYDTEWATLLIAPYLAPDGFVVSLQNCINEPRIAALVGWDKTVGCIAALLSAELHAPGRIRRQAARGGGADPHAVFRVGEVHGRTTRRLAELVEMIATVDTVGATGNLWGERWSKLCVNGMRNGISAATGLGGLARDRNDVLRRLSIELGGEAVRVGQALGYALEEIGKVDPERLARAAEGDRAAFAEVDALVAAGSNIRGRSERQRPSMAQDMAKGRRTEIDFINGFIVARGHEVGCPAPRNAHLTEVVKRVERGEIPAQPENLLES